MASKLELAIETLKISLGRQNPFETLRLVDIIVQIFDNNDIGGSGSYTQMTGPEIELNISKLFDDQQGMLTFLSRSIKADKMYKDANCKVLELFERILCGSHRQKTVEFAPTIAEVMLQFIRASNVSANEKERATIVLRSLVEHKLCARVPLNDVLKQVLLVSHNKKATGRFLQHIYELLGLLANIYPTCLQNGEDYAIRNMLLKIVESVVLTQQLAPFVALGGSLRGLNHFLVNFAPSPIDEPDVCRRLYVCLHYLSDPPEHFRVHDVYIASLDVLAAHATIVASHVFADHAHWHAVLMRRLNETADRAHRKSLFCALNAVHSVVAHTCAEDENDETLTGETTKAIEFYIGHFKGVLLATASNPHQIRIAIRGLGLMAGACSRRLPAANLPELLTLVMQRTEAMGTTTSATNQRPQRTCDLESFPDFVRALSQIMQHVHQLNSAQLNAMQTILVSLMRDFCYLSPLYHRLTVSAILQTFANFVHIGAAALDALLEQCTMRGIVWTCSHKLQLDAADDWDSQKDWKEHITVMSFMPMWLGLTSDRGIGDSIGAEMYGDCCAYADHTDGADNDNAGNAVCNDNDRIRQIKRQMYRHVLNNLFVILDRVNLNLKPRRSSASATTADSIGADEPLYVADPQRDLEPVRTADFHLFFNVVQLFERLLAAQSDDANRDVFVSSAGRFCTLLARKCREHPLVSGFVRLMTAGLRILRRVRYFDASPQPTSAVVQLFVSAQLSLVAGMQGEMQIASLMCLFAAPLSMLADLGSRAAAVDTELSVVYLRAFAIGHAELYVAQAALRSLEQLVAATTTTPTTWLDDLLRNVLPALDAYLMTNGGDSLGHTDAANLPNNGRGKTTQQQRRKRRVIKMPDSASETELLRFQKSVLMFLSTLSPHQCLHLIGVEESDAVHDNTASSFDALAALTRPECSIDNVRLTLHCGDAEPIIALDGLLPRICTLAAQSTDRPAKIAACELLHTIVLYLIGTRQFESTVWRRLCSLMLELGSDGDLAVRQMFEPLLDQLMHYMSMPAQMTDPAMRTLLECLLDGAAHPRSAAVRELAVRSLHTFCDWTVRQFTTTAAADRVLSEVLAQLQRYSVDSVAHRRRGAALAFNSVYRIVRERDGIVSDLWLDVLRTLCINYQLSEHQLHAEDVAFIDADALQPVDAAIDHVLRVLRERSTVFATVSMTTTTRVVPHGWPGATLCDAVDWLLTQCTATQRRFRRRCIGMVQQLAPLVRRSGAGSGGSLRAYLLEAELTVAPGYGLMAMCSALDDGAAPTDASRLLAGLDFLLWICSDALYTDCDALLRCSHIVPAVLRFLSSIKNNNDDDQGSKIKESGSTNAKKTTNACLERIYEFLLKLLPERSGIFMECANWTQCVDSLASITAGLLFAAHEWPDFDVRPSIVNAFVAQYSQVFPPCSVTRIRDHLTHELRTRYAELAVTTEMHMHSTVVPLAALNSAHGISTLLASDGHKDDAPALGPSQLIEQLFDGLAEQRIDGAYAHQLWPDVRVFANSILRIALTNADVDADADRLVIDQLMELIFDMTPLVQPELASAVALHGQHFLNVFDKTIFAFFMRNPAEKLTQIRRRLSTGNALFVANLCRDFVSYVERNQQRHVDRLALRSAAVAVSSVVSQMIATHAVLHATATAGDLVDDDDCMGARRPSGSAETTAIAYSILDLIAHVTLIWPDGLIALGQHLDDLQPFIVHLIATRSVTLELKARAIFLLPCLMDSLTEQHAVIEQALATLQEWHFPLMSDEFPVGSLERGRFVSVLQALLDALVASRSPALLRFVMVAMGTDQKHIIESDIRTAVTKFSQRLGAGSAAYAAGVLTSVPFQMFAQQQQMEPSLRLIVAQRFLLPMLRASGTEAVVRFYGQHLGTILQWADANYGVASSGFAVEQALVTRIGAYRLIEVLACVVSKERLQTDVVLQESLTITPKSMIGMLTSRTIATRTDIFVTNDAVANELYRQYNCAAFAATCTLIANTQTELRFFDGLLFKENATKNEFIWRKIIDCRDSSEYRRHMNAEFAELPHQRQRPISIRSSNAQPKPIADRLLMQSQNVYESSFSQDVTKIDLSHSSVRTDGELLQQDEHTNFVQLERNPINDHELMAVLCAVIRTMFDKSITPVAKNVNCPLWARQLCAVLEDSTQPRNTRYFVAKLVDNCRELFAHYAPTMTGAVLVFLADECNDDGSPNETARLNYFISDMTVTLLEWHQTYTIETAAELYAARKVLKFLMEHAWHERREVFRQRLELVRCLIGVWAPAGVSMPRQLLCDSLNRSALRDSRANLCGLQLNAIVLCASDTELPWTETTRDNYVRCVIANLDNQHSSVYQPAASLLGMLLARLLDNADAHSETNASDSLTVVANPYHDALLAKLNKLRSERSEEKRFTDILLAVHRHYPRICCPFLGKIANLIRTTVNVTLKRNFISLFQAGMHAYGADVFRELLVLGLVDLLRNADHQVQAMHCVNAALPHMNDSQTTSIWPDLVACWQSRNADARAIACEIFLYVLQHAVDIRLQRDAQVQLLHGFSDTSTRIRARCFEFWSNCEHLPARLADRMRGVLEMLYDESVEENFIGYGTQLLLQPAVQSTRAKQAIFPHHQTIGTANAANGTTRQTLTEYQIDVSWSGRDATMRAPLFVQSQQKSRCSNINGFLRATASDSQMAFEPTQDPTASTLLLGTEAAARTQQFSANSHTQSALMFALPVQMLDRRSQRIAGPSPQQRKDGGTNNNVYARLRERFLSAAAGTEATTTAARKWVDLARTRHARDSRQTLAIEGGAVRRRRSGIQLYRRYRYGDFPDLFINNLAFLLPLQALAQLDRQLAGQLFVRIHAAVANACAPDALRPFMLSTCDAMDSILRQTQRCDPLLFGTLMQLAAENARHFDLPAELVAAVAVANRCLAPAICYLERRLHYSWDTDGGRSAKSTVSTIDVEMQHWLKLTELYRALAEPDVVAGIFADKVDVDGWLPRALALESVGDPESALQAYRECIQRGNILETDFAYRSYFDLLAEMGDWSALAAACDGQLDDAAASWDDVWTDDWRTETLLPHMMRARCRQVMRHDGQANRFVKQLEQWVRVPHKADHLNANFGEELMMMHVAAGQWRPARVYGDRRLTAFLAEWPTISVLTRKVRAELLFSIRTVAEMQASTQLLMLAATSAASSNDNDVEEPQAQSGDSIIARGFDRLAERWERDRPRRCDAPRQWDALIAYRASLATVLPAATSTPNAAQRQRLEDAVQASHFRLLALALAQHNVALSNRIVAVVPQRRNERRWLVTRAEHQSLKAGVLGRPMAAQIKLQMQGWDNVEKALTMVEEAENTDASGEVRRRALEVGASIAERLATICDAVTDADVPKLLSEMEKRIGSLANITVDRLKEHLYEHSFRRLHERMELASSDELHTTNTQNNQWFDGQDRGSVHFQLAAFCQLRLAASARSSSAEHVIDYVRNIIASLFQAMQFGSLQARQMFPCILDLPHLQCSEELQTVFNEHAAGVPAWMFLGWIPQMLSVFTFESACFLDALLLRIANAYPMAMFYTFRLTLERRAETLLAHKHQEDDDGTNAAHWSTCVRQMLAVLDNPSAEAFVKALLCLCVPEKKLHPHVLELYLEWNAFVADEDDIDGSKAKTFMRSRLRRMQRKVWPPGQTRGRAYERLEVFRLELLALENADDLYSALVSLSAIIARIEQATNSKAYKKDTLTMLSPWLAHFQWCGNGMTTARNSTANYHELELPGQYPLNVAPQSATLAAAGSAPVHIIKFDPNIHIFESLRRPVRLRVCAADGRTHSYLMKYGEDMRQDQRIQQLLALMQALLAGDSQCRTHGLRLDTYAVVPLSVYGGLLSWLDNTTDASTAVQAWLQRHYRPSAGPLRSAAAAAAPEGGFVATSSNSTAADHTANTGDDGQTLLRSTRAQYERFIKAASGDAVSPQRLRNQHYYGRAAVAYSRQQIVATMRQLEYRMPAELLRGVLCDWAASPDAFFALRANYASSLAAISVAHWLLGVGDRHLSNVLLNGRTGRLVGIDFGLAFGAGVRGHVPELVPFRLTPQFVQVLSPLGVCGALTAGMELALRCWRREHRILAACMEVFVREPTMEWLESARNLDREAANAAAEDGAAPVPWEPEQRIAVARRKLRGANPRAVCFDDLGTGKVATTCKEYLAAYRRLVAGQREHNVRARLPDEGLTVAEQVRCLLDMATDPALLGISYCGIQPWV